MTGEPFIKLVDVEFTYPDGTTALTGINLVIGRGEYVAIIGQNGSGKTTLVKHFNGLLKPKRGGVYVEGISTDKASVNELIGRVGLCFQNPDHQLFCQSVHDEIAFGPNNLGLPPDEIQRRVDEVIELVGLRGIESEHPSFLGKGQRRRVAVGSIIAMKPTVIVVDEPTTGQDWKQSEDMMALLDSLNSQGCTIVIITHNMRIVAEHAKRTIVMHQGRIILDGTTRSVFSKSDVLARTYLQPPQITRLAQLLVDLGFPVDIMTVEEMFAAFQRMSEERSLPTQ